MSQGMKLWWEKQAARIDALSLRERAFMFVSVIALALALADVLALSPAQVTHAQLKQQFAAQSTELHRLREELGATAQPVDASQAVRDELATLDARVQAVNQDIQRMAPLAQGGPALEQVLVQFLRRREGLTLLSVGTLQPETSSAATPVVGTPGLTKRGVDLRVSGPYAELVKYVKTLEEALPVLRWGPMLLKSEKQAPELNLQVYVVGAQP